MPVWKSRLTDCGMEISVVPSTTWPPTASGKVSVELSSKSIAEPKVNAMRSAFSGIS